MGAAAVRVLALLLALAMTAALFIGGAQPAAGGLFPAPWDKLAHLAYFGVLAASLWVADAGRRPWLVIALAALVGLADELHQATLPFREATAGDLAADVLGAALAVALLERVARRRGAATRVRAGER